MPTYLLNFFSGFVLLCSARGAAYAAWLAGLLLCIASTEVRAEGDNPRATFDQANALYERKAFAEAIPMYEALLDAGYRSAAVHFNLGNAFFKTDQLAPAILHYERALRLRPGDEDIEFNLRQARLRRVDKVEPVPELLVVSAWRSFRASLTPVGWLIWAVVWVWLTLTGLGVFMFIRMRALRRLGLFGGLLCLLLSLGCLFLGYQQYSYLNDHSWGIVFASNVYVKSAPDAGSTDLFIIHEGLKVELLERKGDWRKVRLADGKVGWIPAEAVERI